MSKTGRTRGKLLLRKSQLLPKSEPDGLEKSQWTEERIETPEVFPVEAFFKLPVEMKNGLTFTMTKKDRGYNTVTDWVGCPDVTDEVLKKLGLNTREVNPSSAQVKAESATEDQQKSKSKMFIPNFSSLGIVGKEYLKAQREMRAVSGCNATTEPKDVSKPEESVNVCSGATFNSMHSMQDAAAAMSMVGLFFGDHSLFYTTDPERTKKKWIVEVGCSAEVGQNSLSCAFMQNTGTTAIHYNWVKVSHSDPLKLHRYDMDRFIFDSWGGTILPGEIFRVPFLYKSMETGYYSEDWKLLTQPVLENGADIILRMWGVTRQYDPYFLARYHIEETLKSRIPWNIVGYRVQKIVDFLPLKESVYKNKRFPLIHLGPDLFHCHNPHLYYSTGPVFRLGKLYEMVDLRKKKRERLRGPLVWGHGCQDESTEDGESCISSFVSNMPGSKAVKVF